MTEQPRLARRGEHAVSLRRWRGFFQGRKGAQMEVRNSRLQNACEEGISPAEQKRRFTAFLERRSNSELIQIACELLERCSCLGQLVDITDDKFRELHKFTTLIRKLGQDEVERVSLEAPLAERKRLAAAGGLGKLKKDPKAIKSQNAKAEARALWAIAQRKGWIASQFHGALTDAGHKIPFDTARKWLTKLRKTGAC